jgi:PIN domain nuclease of toxin-antitoxin system
MRRKITVLVDSWVWIEYFKGSTASEKFKELLENSQDKVIVSAVNCGSVQFVFAGLFSPG